jgi:apolipoprotein N-acyltransferase
LPVLAAAGSGLLLWSAFPPVAGAEAAWVGLVPLMLLARFTRPAAALRWGFASGLVFWLLTLSWLLRLGHTGAAWPVALTGWLALAAYCALYTGLFVCGLAGVFRLRGGRWWALGAAPVLWVGLEYARAAWFGGFPWNALGISQYRNVALCQAAAVGGVYAVSAFLVFFNAALALTLLRMAARWRGRPAGRWHPELMLGLAACALVWMHGVRAARHWSAFGARARVVRIGAVQPNVPQHKKWPDNYTQEILDRLGDRTRLLLPAEPELIVWPETALPGALPTDGLMRDWLADLPLGSACLLLGAMEIEGREPDLSDARLYNSAFWIEPGGAIAAVYRKRHLVPFGEYVPFEEHVPFLKRFAPLGFSCSAGTEPVVFGLPGGASCAALICFEDVFAYLARDAVAHGAECLVNLTNDAWFDGSAASVQHLSHAVFRCIENRVPMVRCANTGVTGFIDCAGRIDPTTRLMLAAGETHLAEYRVGSVHAAAGVPPTLYRRFGDGVLGLPCAALAVAWLLCLVMRNRRQGGGPPVPPGRTRPVRPDALPSALDA